MVTKTKQSKLKQSYQQTELGLVPKDWEVKTFKDVCWVNQGLQIAISKRHRNPSSKSKKYITIRYLNNGKEIEYINDYSDSVCCEKEDILMTRTGNTGMVVSNAEGVFHNNFFKINYNKKILNRKYLIYYLNQEKIQRIILIKAGRSTIPDLNHNDFYSIPIIYPKKPKEQSAIASILSDTESLLEKLDKIITKKKNIAFGTMQELLTGKKRFLDFSGKWKNTSFEKLGSLDPENLSSKTDGNYEFNYISIDDVNQGHLNGWTKLKFKDAPSRARRKLHYNDILISTVRPNLKSHLLMHIKSDDFVCSTGFSVLRCAEHIDPYFVYYHLFANTISSQIDKILVGSNYPAINSKDVKKLKIPLPPTKKEQTTIGQIIFDMESEINELHKKRDKYLMIKKGMIQKLLKGEIRLQCQ